MDNAADILVKTWERVDRCLSDNRAEKELALHRAAKELERAKREYDSAEAELNAWRQTVQQIKQDITVEKPEA